jgi:RNA polymerase primary sigma factor
MSKKFVNFDADDSISKYFKEVRKSVLLTSEEEIELAKRIKKGDQSAIDKLVNANLKFVVSIVFFGLFLLKVWEYRSELF